MFPVCRNQGTMFSHTYLNNDLVSFACAAHTSLVYAKPLGGRLIYARGPLPFAMMDRPVKRKRSHKSRR